jgi:hypothetical protein
VLDSAETTGDFQRLERMSERMGGRFRGAPLLKRGAKPTFRFAELFFSTILRLIGAGLWLLRAGYSVLRVLWKPGKLLNRLIALGLKRREMSFPLQSAAGGSIRASNS